MITPEKFVELLKCSTLSLVDQRALLSLLPTLTMDQVQEIGKILKADCLEKKHLVGAMERERDKVILSFEADIRQLNQDA